MLVGLRIYEASVHTSITAFPHPYYLLCVLLIDELATASIDALVTRRSLTYIVGEDFDNGIYPCYHRGSLGTIWEPYYDYHGESLDAEHIARRMLYLATEESDVSNGA